ncbi:MAG: hypothetical protein BWK76_17705 [Desulfobulbaceae bacterium A2]|nr:MAG: hypothetical protein BWK76_17705 [Desulfobulbaceae bacterium A2]
MKPLVQLDDWRRYHRDGEQFLHTAEEAARKRPEVFTPEILYNVVAMAIEKYIMAFLMYHGDLAENHTMGDLLRAVELHTGPQPELAARLLRLDAYQEICDMDSYKRRPPSTDDLPDILATGREVREFVRNRLQLPQDSNR